MARPGSRYVCQSCGAAIDGLGRQVPRVWHVGLARRDGRARLVPRRPGAVPCGHPPSVRRPPDPLREVANRPAPRLSVGIHEVDRVLGGGLVPGALVLLGGEPGIGKSTLVLEIAAGVARCEAPGVAGQADGGTDVLYASGEESADQLHLRADRLGLTDGVAGSRIQVLARRISTPSWRPPRRSVPACWWWTRSRR